MRFLKIVSLISFLAACGSEDLNNELASGADALMRDQGPILDFGVDSEVDFGSDFDIDISLDSSDFAIDTLVPDLSSDVAIDRVIQSDIEPCPNNGGLDCPCYGNGSCDDGLMCENDRCIEFPDRDEDLVPDDEDNCPEIANPDQANMDDDGDGDVCDSDRDGDGIINACICYDDEDNVIPCLEEYIRNIRCEDRNNNDVVDYYETDPDNPDTDDDGVNDRIDECPRTVGVVENWGCPIEEDMYVDAGVDAGPDVEVEEDAFEAPDQGVEEVDSEADTMLEPDVEVCALGSENCSCFEDEACNSGLTCVDDVCTVIVILPEEDFEVDAGIEADAEISDEGLEPDMNSDTSVLSDSGSDAQQGEDYDGDGIWDNFDNCPEIPNSEQDDFDGDGLGDACDEDDDNDGLLDVDEDINWNQNVDEGETDWLNPDTDGDDILDEEDECPLAPETVNGYEDEDGCPDQEPVDPCANANCAFDQHCEDGICVLNNDLECGTGVNCPSQTQFCNEFGVCEESTIELCVSSPEEGDAEIHIWHSDPMGEGVDDFGDTTWCIDLNYFEACNAPVEISARDNLDISMPWLGCDSDRSLEEELVVTIDGIEIMYQFVHHPWNCGGGGEGNISIPPEALGCR